MTREEAINEIKSWDFLEGKEIEAIQTLIPELEENEDEKIIMTINNILPFIHDEAYTNNGTTKKDVLNWLEKQKEYIADNRKASTSYDDRIRKAIIKSIEEDSSVYEQEVSKEQMIAYLEKQKDTDKAIEAVERIDKYIDEHVANAHDMKDSNPDKKYYRGWDDALAKMSGILQDVYSGKKQKEQDKCPEYCVRSHCIGCPIYEKQKEQKPKRDIVSSDAIESCMLRYLQSAANRNDDIEIIEDTKAYKSELISIIEKEQKFAEWNEDWQKENIQTHFAFYTYKDDPCTLYLSNVFVEETSRNKGFGTKILAVAEKVAEILGTTYIRLKVKQNSPANAWYRKNGYGYVAFEDGYNWLEKNLEYVKPNKQEWSEEDERKYQCIRSILLTDMDKKVGSWKYSEILEWYEKRGIGRYTNSKLHWKPNEEQMEALKNSAYGIYQNGDGPVLRGLYEQLEKL